MRKVPAATEAQAEAAAEATRQGAPAPNGRAGGPYAGVTQLVESQPSKLLVAGSSPVSRSRLT